MIKPIKIVEVKSEIVGIFENTRNDLKKYNDTIREYNDHRNFLLLKPISRIFKYDALNIFDI